LAGIYQPRRSVTRDDRAAECLFHVRDLSARRPDQAKSEVEERSSAALADLRSFDFAALRSRMTGVSGSDGLGNGRLGRGVELTSDLIQPRFSSSASRRGPALPRRNGRDSAGSGVESILQRSSSAYRNLRSGSVEIGRQAYHDTTGHERFLGRTGELPCGCAPDENPSRFLSSSATFRFGRPIISTTFSPIGRAIAVRSQDVLCGRVI